VSFPTPIAIAANTTYVIAYLAPNGHYPGQDGYGYTVFGKVVSGMDVVNKIVAVPTANRGMHQNVPVKPVVIESMTVVGAGVAKK